MIFIETSVQVKRILAEPQEQDKLERQIQAVASDLYTTNYVWMEFQRTIADDTAYVKQVMLQYSSWGGLMRNIITGQRSFRTRSAARCTRIVGQLHDLSEGDWHYALDICDAFLEEDLEMQFWVNVNPLADPITCDLVTKGISRQLDGNYVVANSCNKETASCHLPDFLGQNLDKLRAIDTYLNDHPNAIKDQTRVQRLLSAVIENPQAVLGQNTCWPLGDIIIALQVPNGAQIWTLDADFATFAQALGLTLYE